MPTRSRIAKILGVGLVHGLVALVGATNVAAQQWIASWGSSLHGLSREDQTITDATIRLIARSTVAGDRVRVRFENTYGTHPLTIGAAAIGVRNNGPSLVIGSNRPLRFDGSPSVTIPAGDSVSSDHVFLDIQAEQELAVSLYVAAADVRSNVHRLALATSYLTEPGAGDQTHDIEGSAYPNTTQRMHWLSAIEVYSSSARGAIVAFGDSITDGSCATPDGHDRWGDVLYGRLLDASGTARLGMVNSGIAGNTTLRLTPAGGTPAVERMDRNVLSLAGITHLIVFSGTNDLRRDATAEQVIAGLDQIIGRAKERGLKVLGATIIPRNPEPRGGLSPEYGFNATRNRHRHAVNEWIRTNDDLDAVLDFDAVLRDPGNHDLLNPIYDCDGIHPNVFGYAAMARAIDLEAFDEKR